MADFQAIQDAYWKRQHSRRRTPDHPVVKAAFEPLSAWVGSLHPHPENASVLDVGCGNGFLTARLGSRFHHVVGSDYSREILEANPWPNLVHASATALPFPDDSFDVVVCCHLLHHLLPHDRIGALEEMRRVARHAVAAIEPNRNNPLMLLFAAAKREERMALRFSKRYVRALLAGISSGRTVIQTTGWITPNRTPTWAIPVSRWLERTPLNRFGVDICGATWPIRR